MDEATQAPTVTNEQLREARDHLNAIIDSKLAGMPVTMAEGPDGQSIVGSLITTVLIGLGVAHLLKK